MNQITLIAEPGQPIITMSRVFDAPRDLVFAAYTDARHIPNWWGPRYLTTIVDHMDARAGGSWRIIQRDPKGSEHAFHGVYHDVVAPERTVGTFEYEGAPGHVLMETAVFEALPDGKTLITTTSVFQSVEDRDGMVASGMESGAKESLERFAELLVKLQSETA